MTIAGKTLDSSGKSRKAAGDNSSDVADVTLDVSTKILNVLHIASKASPIPGIQQAVELVMEITNTVKKVRGNKAGFNDLADEATALVTIVYKANQEVEPKDMPTDLEENMNYMLKVFSSVLEFANKGASRGKFMAYVRSGVDGDQIQGHKEKLSQCLTRFGFQADISNQILINRIAAEQGEIKKLLLENKASGLDGQPGSTSAVAANREKERQDPFGGQMMVTHTKGDKAMNNISNVTTNYDSGNTYTNSNVNQGNSTTINTHYNRAGDSVMNDHSVRLGDGVSLAGASGINFGSGNTNSIAR